MRRPRRCRRRLPFWCECHCVICGAAISPHGPWSPHCSEVCFDSDTAELRRTDLSDFGYSETDETIGPSEPTE